jgi:hypothetical protein
MRRYHFDIKDSAGIHRDEHGEMCTDHQAAEAEAVKVAIEMVRHAIGHWTHFDRAVEVRDESGEPFVRVRVVAKLETQRLK